MSEQKPTPGVVQPRPETGEAKPTPEPCAYDIRRKEMCEWCAKGCMREPTSRFQHQVLEGARWVGKVCSAPTLEAFAEETAAELARVKALMETFVPLFGPGDTTLHLTVEGVLTHAGNELHRLRERNKELEADNARLSAMPKAGSTGYRCSCGALLEIHHCASL